MEIGTVLLAVITLLSTVIGASIAIIGQAYTNKKEHERKKEFLVLETFFKNRLIYLEKLGKQIELDYERIVRILTTLNFLGQNVGNGNVVLGKMTITKAKEILINIIEEVNQEKFTNFKSAGKSIYFDDKSPIISSLGNFISNYSSNTLVLLRGLINKKLNDNNLKENLILSSNKDLRNGKILLDDIRREMLKTNF